MILELRTYSAHPGTGHELVRRMEAVLPLLARHGIRALGVQPSLQVDGGEHVLLARVFASTEERDRLEEAFYSSTDWTSGPRDGVMDLIEHYHTVVLDVSPEAVAALAPSFGSESRQRPTMV